MQRRANLLKLVTVVCVALLGLTAGSVFFGMLIHEESHVMACLLFRVPITSWSLERVVWSSPNNPVNVLIELAGGFGQALASLIFFLCARYYFTQIEAKTVFQRLLDEKRSLQVSIIFGFESSFLAMAFFGVINGLVEGFSYDAYLHIHGYIFLWLGVLAVCAVGATLALYRCQGKYLKM